MEWKDPIVEEVRKTREQLLEKHGGFDGFIRYLKKMEKTHAERVVRQKNNQEYQNGNQSSILTKS